MEKNKLNFLLLVLLFALTAATSLGQAPVSKPPALPADSIPAKVVVDPNTPAGWQRYQFGERPQFSVILPAAPESSAEQMPDSTTIVNLYIAPAVGIGIFAAARLDKIPADLEKAHESRREAFFKEYFGGFAKGFQESMAKNNLSFQLQLLDSQKVVTATGRSGFQQDMSVGPFKGRAQLVFVGTSAFCVLAIWNEQVPTATLETFFKSFKLTASH